MYKMMTQQMKYNYQQSKECMQLTLEMRCNSLRDNWYIQKTLLSCFSYPLGSWYNSTSLLSCTYQAHKRSRKWRRQGRSGSHKTLRHNCYTATIQKHCMIQQGTLCNYQSQ